MAQASLLTGRCIPTLPCKARSSRPQVHLVTGQGLAGFTPQVAAWQEVWPAPCMACRDVGCKGLLRRTSERCACQWVLADITVQWGAAAASVAHVHSSLARFPGSPRSLARWPGCMLFDN